MPSKVILDYGEILSLLKICKFYGLSLNVVYDNFKARGKVESISEYTFSIILENQIPPNIKSLDTSFEFNKEPYHFRGEVVKISGKEIVLLVPSQIEVWAPRKHGRVFCYGKVFCKVNIIRSLSDSELSKMSSIPTSLTNIYRELMKESPSVPMIMKMVKDELARVGNRSYLVLHKQGENMPLPVVIISRYKKPLLLEDTQDYSSYFKRYLGDEIIPFGKFMLDLKWDDDKIKAEVQKFMNYFMQHDIRSIAFVPIFVFESIAGHMWVSTALGKVSKTLTPRDVYYVKAMADIVSESLAKFKLFSLGSEEEYPLPVYDISLGGMKFEIEQYLAKFIDVGTKLKLYLKFNDGKVLTLMGKVIRIDEEEGKLLAAVEFYDMGKAEEVILSNWIEKNKEED